MKQFKGNRPVSDIIEKATKAGFQVDTSELDRGDDGLWLEDPDERLLRIRFNTVSGRYVVWKPGSVLPVATESSELLDGTPWNDELLDIFYEPIVVDTGM